MTSELAWTSHVWNMMRKVSGVCVKMGLISQQVDEEETVLLDLSHLWIFRRVLQSSPPNSYLTFELLPQKVERCLRMIPRWLPCETSAFHLSTSERNATNNLTDWHCSWVKLLINALAVVWCGCGCRPVVWILFFWVTGLQNYKEMVNSSPKGRGEDSEMSAIDWANKRNPKQVCCSSWTLLESWSEERAEDHVSSLGSVIRCIWTSLCTAVRTVSHARWIRLIVSNKN